jgi:hypothetical protein
LSVGARRSRRSAGEEAAEVRKDSQQRWWSLVSTLRRLIVALSVQRQRRRYDFVVSMDEVSVSPEPSWLLFGTK